MEDIDKLTQLLTGVATSQVSVAEAVRDLLNETKLLGEKVFHEDSARDAPATGSHAKQVVQGVSLDLDRQRRCGFPEVIYGQGKPAEMIVAIIRKQQSAGQSSLATRVDPETAQKVLSQIPDAIYNTVGRTVASSVPLANTQRETVSSPQPLSHVVDPHPGRHVAVITAGSTDAPVAEEAIETLKWMNIPFRSFHDIGVAGPARLLAAVPALRQATAVIVIAGMEGALPAAVGGHLSVPVFAVPTSVGYGATLGGLTPMLGMLSSCASNVAVVNIDAGFKAAYLAGLVLKGPSENQA